jgi:hypothetical protein
MGMVTERQDEAAGAAGVDTSDDENDNAVEMDDPKYYFWGINPLYVA